MSRKLVVHVVGARPNYMKVAPVFAELAQAGIVEQRLVHTGQHYDREINDVFFDELPLPAPDAQLRVGSGLHGEQTAKALAGLERIFMEWEPDLVLVPGDVNSTVAGALAAAKLNIAVCHLEAGLRSFDTAMPEEHNRRVTDHLSSLLLTHCEDAQVNLAAEGIVGDHVAFVGNTMIDTLFANVGAARSQAAWEQFGLEAGRYALVTLHRPRLVDDPELMRQTFAALEDLAETLPVIFPVHPRTRARLEADGIRTSSRIVLAGPQPYTSFLSLQSEAAAVVTDSGGVQEETTALGVRCFTLRDNTERPITVTHGTNTLLGLDPAAIRRIPSLLRVERLNATPPLWDGRAGSRAAAAIEQFVTGAGESDLVARAV